MAITADQIRNILERLYDWNTEVSCGMVEDTIRQNVGGSLSISEYDIENLLTDVFSQVASRVASDIAYSLDEWAYDGDYSPEGVENARYEIVSAMERTRDAIFTEAPDQILALIEEEQAPPAPAAAPSFDVEVIAARIAEAVTGVLTDTLTPTVPEPAPEPAVRTTSLRLDAAPANIFRDDDGGSWYAWFPNPETGGEDRMNLVLVAEDHSVLTDDLVIEHGQTLRVHFDTGWREYSYCGLYCNPDNGGVLHRTDD